MTNEIKTWQERYNANGGSVEDCANAEIAELRAKVESLAADAERFTEQDVRMLKSVAAYMQIDDSPKCAADLLDLAERIFMAKEKVE